jgi:hypothetical protein
MCVGPLGSSVGSALAMKEEVAGRVADASVPPLAAPVGRG